MTQARTTAPGLGNPPLIQLLLEAVACAFVCLVETVRARFGMRFNRRDHDWHMTPAHEALPQTKPDNHIKDPTTRSDKALEACPLARVPGAGRDPASAQRALAARTVIPAEARQRMRNDEICVSINSLS